MKEVDYRDAPRLKNCKEGKIKDMLSYTYILTNILTMIDLSFLTFNFLSMNL